MSQDCDMDRRAASLFDLLDSEGVGFITSTELGRCCTDLSEEELQEIFQQLDADGDGRIGLQDFQLGFMQMGKAMAVKQQCGDSCRELSARAYSQDDLDRDPDLDANSADASRRTSSNSNDLPVEGAEQLSCGDQVAQLHRMLSHQCPHLLESFEAIMADVAKDVGAQKRERQRLEESWLRAKAENEEHARQLEEEMESQLSKMEARVRDAERKRLQDEYQELLKTKLQEIDELQAMIEGLQQHQQLVLPPESDPGTRQKMDEAEQRNRQLLADMRQLETSLALSRSELARLRQDSDGKQREMEHERRNLHEYLREQQRLTEQLQALHEANRQLHDTNDDLREALERQRDLRSPSSGRGSFSRQDSSVADCLSIFDPALSHHEAVLPVNDVCEEDFDGVERQRSGYDFELDSGNSTFREGGAADAHSDYNDDMLPDEFELLAGSESMTTVARRPNSLSMGRSTSDEEDDAATDFEAASSQRKRWRRRGRHLAARSGTASPAPALQLGPPQRMFKVVLAGDAAVGKSSFIMRFCEQRFVGNLMSTLGVDFKTRTMEVDDQVVAMQLWDTAGQERFRSIAKSYFRRADAVILLYDCTFERSFASVRDWVTSIEDCADSGVPIMLVGNKTDIRDEVQQSGVKVVEYEDGQRLADEFGAALFVEASARSGSNVADGVRELCRLLQLREDQQVGCVGDIHLKEKADDRKKLACCP